MPEAVVLAISEVVGAISAEAGFFIGSNAAIISTAATVAGTAALSAAQAKRARQKARDAYNASQVDRLQSIFTTIAPRELVMGRVRKGGALFWRQSTGADKEKLVILTALAGHECDAIEAVYLNDVEVTLDGDYPSDADGGGYVTSEPYTLSRKETVTESFTGASITLAHTPITDSVKVLETSGSDLDALSYEVAFTLAGSTVTVGGSGSRIVRYQTAVGPSKARVWWHLGAAGQAADERLMELFPSEWTVDHRAEDTTYIVAELDYDETAFPHSIPQITVRMRGAKLWDPRDDSTAWSENPALMQAHVLLHPNFGKRTSLLDAEADRISAAASACDTSHDYVVDGETITRPLYTAAYVVALGGPAKDVLDDLSQAMAGTWVFVSGQFYTRAGVYTAAVKSFTEADLATRQTTADGAELQRSMTVSVHQARNDRVNTVTARIWDPEQEYKQVALTPVAPTALVARDGATLAREITLTAVNHAAQAQHVCGVMLRDERDPVSFTMPFKLTAYEIEPLDVIALTLEEYGWEAKEFIVRNRTWSHDGAIILSGKETAPEIFEVDAEFLPQGYAENTGLPRPWEIDPPTITAIDSGTGQLRRQADGTLVPRVQVTWAAITDASLLQGGFIEVAYAVNTGDWQVVTTTADQTSLYITGVREDDVVVLKARSRNPVASSDWTTLESHVVVGKTAAPNPVTDLTATAIAGGIRLKCTLPADPDLSHLELWRGTTSTLANAVKLGEALQTSFDDMGLSASDGARYYWVYAVDTTGNRSAAAGPVSTTASNLNALTITSNAGNVINVSYGGVLSPTSITLTATKSSGLAGTIQWSVASGSATLGSSSGSTTSISTSTVASQSLTVRATIQGIALYRWDSTVGSWTITNSGRTATKTIAGGPLTIGSQYTSQASPTSADTTLAGKNTYCEFPITTRGGNGRIGIGVAGSAAQHLMDAGGTTCWGIFSAVSTATTVSGIPKCGRSEGGTLTLDTTYQFSPGVRLAIAARLATATKKLWFRADGAWLNGDPEDDTGGMVVTGTINRFIVTLVNPSGETNTYALDINPTSGTQVDACPSGFTPYGPLEADVTADFIINKQVASISGSDIATAGTVVPSALGTGTVTVNSVEFQFGSGITIGSQSAGGGFKANGTNRFGFIVGNVGGGDAFGGGTTATGATYAAGHFVGGANSGFTTYKTWARLALGDTAAGDFGHAGASTLPGTFAYRCQLATNGYAAFADTGWGKQYFKDGAGPFTWFHQGVAPKGEFVDGDIVVRTGVLEKQDVSNVRFQVEISTIACQRGVLGVVSGVRDIGYELSYEKWWELYETHCLVDSNAGGEGQINVCGLGGDIEVDDFIVTSALPGKGMRQADDVAHGYTVAKASEACKFSSPDEVKTIACIYLAG